MTATMQQVGRRMAAAEELRSVTHTMRGLAAVNLRRFEIAAEALDAYEEIVERGLQVVVGNPDFPLDIVTAGASVTHSEYALIVFGSSQGLCGPINRHVTQQTTEALDGISGSCVDVMAVGNRLRTELELGGITVSDLVDLPGTVGGITRRAADVLERVELWRIERPNLVVFMSFPAYAGRHTAYEPVVRRLVPYDPDRIRQIAERPWPTRSLPIHTLDTGRLFGELTRQALFVGIHRSFAQTMASVAASRLTAMDGAREKIEEQLAELQRQHHQIRQSSITEELLDVVSGFEVLRS